VERRVKAPGADLKAAPFQSAATLKPLSAYAEVLVLIARQKLPILDGFVAAGAKPLEQYELGFYQFTIEVLPGEAGATVVRLSAKITAWYADREWPNQDMKCRRRIGGWSWI
jgi:hypothetical protein